MKDKKILLAMPSFSGLIPDRVCQAVVTMHKPCTCMFTIVSRAPIAATRNIFAKYVIENKLDGVLFMDDDNPAPDNTLIRYLESDKDIIGAFIPKRRPNHEICVYFDHYVDGQFKCYRHINFKPEAELLECDAIGSGLTYIKREVLEHIVKSDNNISEIDFSKWNTYKKPFDYLYVDNEALSEDLSLCRKAKLLGYKIFCDTTIRPIHIGEPKVFGVNENFEVFCG
jgi:hypothetical protein